MIKQSADGRVPSPCISVCRIDDASNLCVGCLRTLSEIATWSEMRDDERRDVWARLAERATSAMSGALNADR
jgi:predicted Fe-S protein YdhL (DUF1289 family)